MGTNIRISSILGNTKSYIFFAYLSNKKHVTKPHCYPAERKSQPLSAGRPAILSYEHFLLKQTEHITKHFPPSPLLPISYQT